MSKNKKNIKVNIDTDYDNSYTSIEKEYETKLDYAEKGENILNFLSILKDNNTEKKTYLTTKTFNTTTNPFYNKTFLTPVPPPPIPPLPIPTIKKDQPNENLLIDLQNLDKKLDEILNLITEKNIGTDSYDNNLKIHIELLRDKIDYKSNIISEEISCKFGKKPFNKFFPTFATLNTSNNFNNFNNFTNLKYNDNNDYNNDNLKDKNNIDFSEYDDKKKIFI